MAISGAIMTAGQRLPDLGARLGSEGTTFLDIGTGTGWLSIAMARSYPNLHVVGIDIFEPALDLARTNVREAGLDTRVELLSQDATKLAEGGQYDVIWLPLPFLPGAIIESVITASTRALRPGGWLLPRDLRRARGQAVPVAQRPADRALRRTPVAVGRDHRNAHYRWVRRSTRDRPQLGGAGPAMGRAAQLSN